MDSDTWEALLYCVIVAEDRVTSTSDFKKIERAHDWLMSQEVER